MMDAMKMPKQEDHEYDPTRQMVDLAVSCGRRFQSPQTGFIHYFYSKRDEEGHDTIPLYDNFLFTLALLRFRMKHSVEEAKTLLPKLLAFQNLESGNFPRYLHDYPKCFESYQAAKLLPVFYFVQKDYRGILGQELVDQLQNASRNALEYCFSMVKEKEPPFQIAIKMACSAKAFGALWNEKDWIDRGEKLLDKLNEESKQDAFGTWFSPQYIGDTLTSLQMIYQEGIEESPWAHFWELLSRSFDPKTFSYVGPSLQDEQYKEEPKCTLYDFALGHLFKTFNYRCFLVQPIQLQAALVHTNPNPLIPKQTPFVYESSVAGYNWVMQRKEAYTISSLQKKGHLDPHREKRFQPFRLLWGDLNKLHTLVCQGGNVSTVDFLMQDEGMQLDVLVDGPVPEDQRGGVHELAFFCDREEGLQVFVEEQKATTFKLGDKVTIETETLRIHLRFYMEKGQGRFFGHIMPGNRPSQVACYGKRRFEAYDWQISLRTVQRYSPCELRVMVQCEEKPKRELLSISDV